MKEDFEMLQFFSDLESGVYDFPKPKKKSRSKYRKKVKKRKYVRSILVGVILLFGPVKASAKPFDKNIYETVISKDFSRGGFSTRPVNMEILARKLSQEYREYQEKFNSPTLSKRFDTLKFSPVRFQELARDPNSLKEIYHKTTVDEARSALQAEIMGIVEGVERIPQPYFKSIDLDFQISGPAPYSHLDMKHPVGSRILQKQKSPYTLQESSLNKVH